MSYAKAIVKGLLEDDEAVDPKEFAQSIPPSDGFAVDTIQEALNKILNLPYDDLERFYAEATKITNELVDTLEGLTRRRALDGTKAMFRASVPKPWNLERGRDIRPVLRSHAREFLVTFRNCSKKIKQA